MIEQERTVRSIQQLQATVEENEVLQRERERRIKHNKDIIEKVKQEKYEKLIKRQTEQTSFDLELKIMEEKQQEEANLLNVVHLLSPSSSQPECSSSSSTSLKRKQDELPSLDIEKNKKTKVLDLFNAEYPGDIDDEPLTPPSPTDSEKDDDKAEENNKENMVVEYYYFPLNVLIPAVELNYEPGDIGDRRISHLKERTRLESIRRQIFNLWNTQYGFQKSKDKKAFHASSYGGDIPISITSEECQIRLNAFLPHMSIIPIIKHLINECFTAQVDIDVAAQLIQKTPFHKAISHTKEMMQDYLAQFMHLARCQLTPRQPFSFKNGFPSENKIPYQYYSIIYKLFSIEIPIPIKQDLTTLTYLLHDTLFFNKQENPIIFAQKLVDVEGKPWTPLKMKKLGKTMLTHYPEPIKSILDLDKSDFTQKRESGLVWIHPMF